MRKLRRKYKRPRRPWDKGRIEEERKLMNTYGLSRKKEIWKIESVLRSFRRRARDLTAKRNEEEVEKLLERLQKMGLLEKNATLSDVLSLTLEDLFERRLQTLVFKKGLANTPKHSRQLIVHGHILINDRKMIYPGYIVPKGLENKIERHNYSDTDKIPQEGGS
jgi:small subunit ribosomal protein S4